MTYVYVANPSIDLLFEGEIMETFPSQDVLCLIK